MSNQLVVADTGPKFPDVKITGRNGDVTVLPSMANALVALNAMGVDCSYDEFHDRRYVAGQVLGSHVGQLTDDVCLLIRAMCRERYEFDPGKEHTWDAVNLKARMHSFHPVRDYLDSLRAADDFSGSAWDGKPRIESWMIDYLGAPDTALVRTMSRLVLIASVRRIMQPGCKWDYMPVLVGPENKAKSLAIATLYGQEHFSDQKIIGASDKELAETLRGRWGHESAELAGRHRADWDHLKAQITRQSDRVRPAYGRAVIEVPRQCALWGTTNDPIFLRQAHGNRRLVPINVPGMVKIAELTRDRDQLWAEAVEAEREYGSSLALPEAVWEEARESQEAHTEADPWDEILYDVSERAARDAAQTRAAHLSTPSEAHRDVVGYQRIRAYERPKHDPEAPHGVERIASGWLLTTALRIAIENQNAAHTHRLSSRMQAFGWSEPRLMKIAGRAQRGYERPLTAAAAGAPEPAVSDGDDFAP